MGRACNIALRYRFTYRATRRSIESKSGHSFFHNIRCTIIINHRSSIVYLTLPSAILQQMEVINSIAIPGGSPRKTCGYCSEPGRRREAPLTSFHSATLEAIRLTCGVGVLCFQPEPFTFSR